MLSRSSRAPGKKFDELRFCSRPMPMVRNWIDQRIAEAFSCRTRTVERLRQRFVEQGFEETLNRVERQATTRREAVDGRPRSPHHRDSTWSAAEGLQLLDAAVVGTRGRGTGNRALGKLRNGPAHAKKNGMTNRKIEYWVIPPEADAEFVAHMEEVLETYEKPYNPESARSVHGRTTCAVAERNAHTHCSLGQARQASSLRIRMSGDGRHLHETRSHIGYFTGGRSSKRGLRLGTGENRYACRP